jgi:CMP-N-acetylneuraminic acid synthetase
VGHLSHLNHQAEVHTAMWSHPSKNHAVFLAQAIERRENTFTLVATTLVRRSLPKLLNIEQAYKLMVRSKYCYTSSHVIHAINCADSPYRQWQHRLASIKAVNAESILLIRLLGLNFTWHHTRIPSPASRLFLRSLLVSA